MLHSRDTLVRERTHLLNSLRGHLKVYGVKQLGSYGTKFYSRVRKAIEELHPRVRLSCESLLAVLQAVEVEIEKIEAEIHMLCHKDEDIQLLQSMDGVGTIVALAFKSEIDRPQRFRKSRDVAAYLGLTPGQYSSGETKRQGGISRKGSKQVRYLLVEAATVLLTRCKKWSRLKAWGMKLMKKRGKKKGIVAVARKMAVILHQMWITKKLFERGQPKDKTTEKKVA